MSDAASYRHDPMEDCWRIVAPSRAEVPPDTVAKGPLLPAPEGRCPFCPGHESDAEEIVAQFPTAADWQVRAVTNRFPAVSGEVVPPDTVGGHARPATGVHEIIVEGREHEGDLPDFTPALRTLVLQAYRDRLRAVEATDGIRHVAMFRNRGRRAGSSQPHPHGQLVGTTVGGRLHERRWTLARAHARREGRSLLDTVLARELDADERIVESSEDFVVFCPFAPQVDYQTWIVPRLERGSFSALDDASVERFGEVLAKTLKRVIEVSGRKAYNVLWRLPPVRSHADPASFWYVDILPRGGGLAGVELSTGFSMVSVAPERAAEQLRG
ncbi:MAG: hypothetical protein CMN30_31585 [Sandaracinus sp.]|nr:hypothetical protein [Sandaracinus sp.]|tara:strand:- start:8886 stop:9866 length:981 start_codon:yes stop_codon:yes gene_type:complete